MTIPLSGQPISYWIDSTTAQFPSLAELDRSLRVDVAIVGGGIAGLTAALLLKRAGKTVAVIEAAQIAAGVSGHTTAKVTSLHQLIYADLIREIGEQKARVYAESNQAAIEQVAAFVAEEDIDCDFSRQNAYTYAETADQLDQITAEVEAASRLGLPASFVQQTTLPFKIAGAVKFANQAQFHVRKYLLHLAAKIVGDGSYVLEQTRVTGVEEGAPCEVKTHHGVIRASDVLITTHAPILDQGLFFAKTYPKRSYIVAAEIPSDRAPVGMFIGSGSDYHSIRTTPYGDQTLLLIGGGGHNVGTVTQTEERYQKLEAFARSRFGVERINYRWSTQDLVSFDKLPYIGKLTPFSEHVFVATGFSLWGMTKGTLAGMLLFDRVLGFENAWAALYEATRVTPFMQPESLRENVQVGVHWLGDRLKGFTAGSLANLQPGEAKILNLEGKKVAAYRNPQGEVAAVSAICSHLGCVVNWNSAEQSWDCPCHGARFNCRGEVLQGPAIADLEVYQTIPENSMQR